MQKTGLILLIFVSACQWNNPPAGTTNIQNFADSTYAQNIIDTVSVISDSADSVDINLVLSDSLSQDSIAAIIDQLQAQVAALQNQNGSRIDSSQVAEDQNVLEEAGDQIKYFGWRLFWAALILVFAQYLIQGLVYILDALAEQSAGRRLFYKKLVPIVRIIVWVFTFYFIVSGIFQVDAQGIMAAATALGVAIGFAGQEVLKNIFGGLVIIFDQPFQVGDKVAVGGTYGEVVSIGLRSTRIVTPDDNLVSVPNAQVVDGQVSNANAGALDCQVVTDLFLPGWVDEQKAKKIAYETAITSRYVYLQKPVVVLIKDVFRETFLTQVRIKAYVIDTRYEFLLMSDITERARAEFRVQGLFNPTANTRTWQPPEPPADPTITESVTDKSISGDE